MKYKIFKYIDIPLEDIDYRKCNDEYYLAENLILDENTMEYLPYKTRSINMEKQKYEHIYNIGAYEIQQYQQNRYPLFFLDVVEEVIPGEYVRAKKNFTYDEWFFPAHFADEPNVPGFIQIEILAQTFIMTFLTIPEHKGKKTAFLNVDNLRMRQKIVPGDVMIIEGFLKSFRRGIAQGHVEAKVNGENALSADLKIGVPDIMRKFIPKREQD